MAAPFSNTHLRVPRGFGTVLEGLAREVLRDQPEDIPTYAMKYFNDLLKQRDESGMDPAEWAARLEDRYYNNHAFKKNTETSHEKESEPEAIISEGKSQESETENESSHSAEVSALSITQPDVSEKDDSTEGSDEEEKVNIIERFATEEQHSKGHSVAARQSDEESNTDEEKDPPETTFDQDDRPNFKMDDDPTSDENISQFHSELTDLLSFKDIPNVDMFSHESEDDADDHQGGALEEDKIVDSEEENTEVTEAVEAVLYSGPADVDFCAAELGRTEEPLEKYSAQDNTYVDEDDEEEESLNLQLDTELSHYEISQGSQQEAEDEAQNINEGEILETGASREESNKSSALNENNLDDNPILKEDSLVEVSFEDVPEAQHITEDEEETLMEDASAEILRNTELEMEQTEESIELTTSLTDLNISNMDEQIKPEMDEVMKDDISEEEEIESHHASFDMMKEKVDTNNSNLHDGGNGERTSTVADLEETDEEMEKQEIASLTHSADWTAADNEEEDGPHEYEKDATASANKSDKEECSRPQEEEDIMDIPLDDPEANRAAAKIQAGFRGHMTRKKMKPEDKTEGEEVSSTGDVLSSSQGVSETGRSGAVERDDTSVPEQ